MCMFAASSSPSLRSRIRQNSDPSDAQHPVAFRFTTRRVSKALPCPGSFDSKPESPTRVNPPYKQRSPNPNACRDFIDHANQGPSGPPIER
ncbi:hypothetical protein RB2451 [Rhodopirellula baltica SH 1]|uniref:Uncharacterized protein n=1 Tax=Rhodopirellula baltica (strain DSM 10527 / NCIMB 13988 / SH1) TaxID=243090 RepID=Q7UVT8_RHOBA|nr:hypothetical protein RB2451 [Rhodopirellula baltica SH 1]